MNLPNKLTLSRCILVLPVVILLLAAPERGWPFWLSSLVLFCIASITDAFDGSIARKRGLVTNFGKLMDPVADKLLVTAVFACFTAQGLCSPWVLIIVLAREFLVLSVRMVAASNGTVIPANIWGKLKTITQMTAIIVIYAIRVFISLFPQLGEALSWLPYIGDALLWLSAAITVVSGIIYCWQSRELFKDIK